MLPKISVVIITKNEEERITDCIKSVVGWADEVLVVDDESTDKTQHIAQELGAKVLVKEMRVEGAHRNWAYQQASNQWVLSLDADERVTEELKEEISKILNSNPDCVSFSISRKNHIGDYWLRWGGQYPSKQIKLIRKDKFKWEEVEVHPRAFSEGKNGELSGDIIHYTYRNWGDFLRKLDSQTTLEAKKWYDYSFKNPKKAKYKMNVTHALWRVFDRFMRTYFRKKGYRDGFIGFMIAYFASLYQIVSYAKYRELKK
ncbi:glycosyltransferase family 2 protein [Candidatus Babeliales bacterium]|jgi:glycosyltransferase involved in cell wall biosynthesis|nr:glycosyltransferase family 2 protein [Candidatus Babeliales bacterium]MCF7917141.1 glycosyltransferase family 2 protein [Candidatus Omnitrophota bacterium]